MSHARANAADVAGEVKDIVDRVVGKEPLDGGLVARIELFGGRRHDAE